MLTYALIGGEYEGEYSPGHELHTKLARCPFQVLNSTVTLVCPQCHEATNYRWIAVSDTRIVLAVDTGIPVPEMVS